VDISDLEGAKLVQERTFTKESLFGYMNGGAELYLEYGFDRLVVTDLIVNGEDLKVEVYRMPSSDMAFGIYSVNIFRCDKSVPLAEYYCQSDYQVQFHKGDYYVNIINNNGSSNGITVARIIAKNLIESVSKASFNKTEFIPEKFMPENISKMMLIAGDVALSNYAFEYSKYLEQYSDYRLLVVEHDKGTLLLLRFDNGDFIVIPIDGK
jgi:hypothetical protein